MTQSGINPANVLSDAANLGTKLLTGGRLMSAVRDTDVQIATTPKDLIWSQDKVSLFHFCPLAEKRIGTPLLICYGLVGRWTMTDLQEDQLLVRNLLNLGVDLYVVDWGNLSRADRFLTLDNYILGYLDGCMGEIAKRAGVPKVNLLDVCEGGVFATAFAALEPERVNTLALTITPIDFHADTIEDRLGHGFINIWTRSLLSEDVDQLIDANGNLPGEFMGAIFSQTSPVRSLLKYNIDMLDIVDDEQRLMNWLRMEKWIADRPDHPGEAAKQWMKDLYQQNKLVRNEWELNGRRVDLGNIRMPVLNVYAKDDHIIPPATSRALGPKLDTSDYGTGSAGWACSAAAGRRRCSHGGGIVCGTTRPGRRVMRTIIPTASKFDPQASRPPRHADERRLPRFCRFTWNSRGWRGGVCPQADRRPDPWARHAEVDVSDESVFWTVGAALCAGPATAGR